MIKWLDLQTAALNQLISRRTTQRVLCNYMGINSNKIIIIKKIVGAMIKNNKMQFKITFHIFNQYIWFRYSKESSQLEGSFDHPKQILKLMSKKFSIILSPTFLAHLSQRLMGKLIVYQ